MEIINEFANQFGAHLRLDKSLIVQKQDRYFLLNQALKRLVTKDFFYAGLYLGKIKKKRFFPSFILLKMIAQKKANRIIVDEKSAWLFVCGRDIFRRGIIEAEGSKRKGAYTLILNQHDECLGFGKILRDLGEAKTGVAVKNISDIGDFLRRERQ